MSDYSKSKIYKITSKNTDKIYIGSTVKSLNDRLSNHTMFYKKWIKFNKNITLKYTSVFIIECCEYEIELIEDYPCNSKKEKELREAFYIKKYMNLGLAVNHNIPCRTHAEWYDANKEILKIKKQIYTKNNKEKISKQRKEFYEKNKEKIKAERKIYRENNKEKIKNIKAEKYTCDCGAFITKAYKKKHELNNKHQSYINNL